MSSKYDIAIYRDVRYKKLARKASDRLVFGKRVGGPWEGSAQTAAAQVGRHVVILAPAWIVSD